MTNWIKTSERQPTVKDVYLVAYKFLDFIAYDTCRWAPNLHDVDKYDFADDEYKRSGFYEYDSEYGYYERKPLAWQPIEDYIEE